MNLQLAGCNENVSVAREAYFKELQYMRAYEVTMPIVYKIPLIKAKEQLKTLDTKLQTLYARHNGTILPSMTALNETLTRIAQLEEDMISDFIEEKPKLRKRSVTDGVNFIRDFFRDILVACCKVLTYRDGKSMLQNEKSIAKSYEALKQTMLTDHRNLIQINEQQNNLIKYISSLDEKLTTKFEEIDNYLKRVIFDMDLQAVIRTQDFLNLGQSYYNTLLMETLKFRQMLDSCKNFRLSTNVVNKNTLKDNLENL